MDKRGIAWLFMIELLGGIFAAFVIVNAAQLWASTDIFFETKIARDVALITNSLYPVQGNIVSEYPTELSRFILNLENNQVEVYKQGDFFKPSSLFVNKKGNIIVKTVMDENLLEFSKSAGNIEMGSKGNLNKLECPKKQGASQNIDSMHFLLDPGIGVSPVAGDLSESEINRLVALGLSRRLSIKDSTRNLNIDESRPIDWLSKITRDTDIILSFHAGSYDYEGNIVKAYVPDNDDKQESVSLACNIINSLLDRYDDGSIVLLNRDNIDSMDEGKRIMDNDKVSVMLKIGNIKNPSTLSDYPVISDLIYKGLEGYYAG